jgi:3-phenylpropionate/trans-cinnamate dioxygenase ferredoxin subunit
MWVEILDGPPKEGVMLEVCVQGREVFVTQNNGKLYCAENRCPHEDIKLTLGCFKGVRIKCSLHGFSFDLNTGESSEPDMEKLTTFPIKQQAQKIYIQIS